MASYTTKDIRSLDRRSMVFLSLAPTTSESYPSASTTAQNTTPKRPAVRRTSSQSSAGSAGGLRFLTLGPVHYGEHPDQKGDFHEVAVEESP